MSREGEYKCLIAEVKVHGPQLSEVAALVRGAGDSGILVHILHFVRSF